MDAVRVPPSACITSQSIFIVLSPNFDRSTPARKDLPISLWISCDLPRGCFSRSFLGEVEPGSMEYSAVTHPCPEPSRNGGVFSSMLAEQRILVFPVEIMTDPSANSIGSVIISIALGSMCPLPSIRIFSSF